MQKKNLIIALLAITSVICIFIINNQRTIQKKSNFLGFQQTADFSFDQSQIELAKKELFHLYEPSKNTCGAAVSLSKRTPFSASSRFDMACLILGARKVIWETIQDVENDLRSEKNDFNAELDMFKNLIKAEGIKELDGFSYRPEGKRNALLLVKEDILRKQNPDLHNDYLIGSLLGYDEKDIEFFYQRLPFNSWYQENSKTPLEYSLVPFSYADFSTDLKKQFEYYKKNEWLHSKEYSRYERDKKNAFAWLDENKKFTDEELSDQIQNLKNEIKIIYCASSVPSRRSSSYGRQAGRVSQPLLDLVRQGSAPWIPIFAAEKILSWLGFAMGRKTANAAWASPVSAFSCLASVGSFTAVFRNT